MILNLGKPDSDEEKEVERSPRSSIPESPIGSKTKTRSTTSNMSPHSEISVSISESSKRKRRLFNVKRSLVLLDGIFINLIIINPFYFILFYR